MFKLININAYFSVNIIFKIKTGTSFYLLGKSLISVFLDSFLLKKD